MMEKRVTNRSHLQLVKPGVLPPPATDPSVCPSCKMTLSEGCHGWMRDYSVHYNHTGHHRKFGYCEVPCPTCSGPVEHLREAQRKAAMVTRLFGASQIPWDARNWTFDTFPVDGDALARQQVQQFTRGILLSDEQMKRGLWLGGAAGRGKTGLAICAMKALMSRERATLFVSTIELMNKLRASFGKQSEITEDELLNAVTQTDIVVFDDIATERPSAYVLEQLYYIVEKRRSNGLYSIFTSNLSTPDLENYWRPETVQAGEFYPGLRVVERIREYCTGVAVSGRNQRG